MKEELPEAYNKPSTKSEESKMDQTGPSPASASSEPAETKTGGEEEKPASDSTTLAAPPSQGNVATASAAALASAAVKAKVSSFLHQRQLHLKVYHTL